MNNIKIFENREFGEIRTVMIDGAPWFVGKDVAGALGYSKERNAIASHVEEDDRKVAPIQGPLGGTQDMTLISESGMYSLIFGSKLDSARRFKHWVTSEVLPSIRQTGTYSMARQVPLTEHPGEVANLIKVVTNRMDKQGSAPYESMDAARLICEQFGIHLPENIVKIPEYEQMRLSDFMGVTRATG